MKPLFPVYCRLLGYIVLIISLFLPFLLVMVGWINDGNLLFYKECIKLLMMMGALFILFAYTKKETAATTEIRNKATRNAIFLTIFIVFATMLYKVFMGDIVTVDSSSFLTFLIVNVLCLEFGLKKAQIDSMFKR